MAALKFLRVCALLQALGNAQAFAPPWTVTQYFEATVYTYPARTRYYGTYPASTTTITTDVIPTVTSPRATTTITTSNWNDVTVISIGLESDQATSSQYSYRSSSLDYYIPLTYTYPTSCSVTSGESTITTSGSVVIPTEVQHLVTPTATSTVTSTNSYRYGRSTRTYTETVAFLDPTDLPSSVYSSVEARNTPTEISYCESRSGYGSGSSSGSSSDYGYYGSYCGRYYCSDAYWAGPLALALIITFSWFGFFFIVGLIESAIRFRNLMIGRGASRGLPKSFACLCPLLSCLFIICMHRGYRPKSKEEQAVLASNWKSMSFTAKFALWLKYGFSRNYPPPLGAAPPLATDPLPTDQQLPMTQAPVPGVMAPLPYQMASQPLPHQPEQQTARQLENQLPEQQLHAQSTGQQPGSPQRESQHKPLPVPAPYQPLPAVAHSGNPALFEQPGHAVSPASGSISPIPRQSELAQPCGPSHEQHEHEQHVHAEQPQEVPADRTEGPTEAPKTT
ncbi:hypothetical protein FQN49_003721 [Arthroderma sp. PD_2]|nr:hypothetical protein FQN49_003721 [Arthroderma sp. PD_2]